MKRIIIISLISIISVFVSGQNLKQVKISLSNVETVTKLLNASLPLEEGKVTKDNNLIIFLNIDEIAKVNGLGIGYEVLIEDWKAYYSSLPQLSDEEKAAIIANSKESYGVEGFGFGSMGGYYTYSEVLQKLDSMVIQYPNLITPKWSIGTTHEGRPLWVVKISDNPNVNENEPQVFFDGLIHAREAQSLATVMYFMYYLLENYGTNPEVTYLVNNREIYFLPVLNPDGYVYNQTTNPSGGGDWRKNRRNNSGSYGVDLNRNFGYKWGFDNSGSSNIPSDETYRGPSAFSEPEAFHFRDFVLSKNIKTHINYHSYNNSIIYPWGYINQFTPDSLTYVEYASYMSQFNGYDYGTSYQTLSYVSNGTVRDWMYGEQALKGKTISYTFEVGSYSDGFWPAQSRIFPLAQGNVVPNLFNSWVAGDYIKYLAAAYDKPYFMPGDSINMSVTLRNQGLSAGYNVNMELISLNGSAQVLSPAVNIDSVQARSNYICPTNLVFRIAPDAPHNQLIKLICKTSIQGTTMSSDTISLPLGIPVYKFKDSANAVATNWNVTATPVTPKWGETTASFVSAPNSYTDSPSGNYVANATIAMTSINPIDLMNSVSPKLTFWTKYDIESNWDYGQLKVSTDNGTTWTPLQGKYTEPGQGSFQPAGQPVYDGPRTTWVKEEISLGSFSNKLIKLRFELKSDGSVFKDGWYVDDISILDYSVVPVELLLFTASQAQDDNSIVIEWETATEENNRGFEVQRIDASDWKTLGFVEGRGTSTSQSKYHFNDYTPNIGTNRYRLKQVDFDGSYKIYEPVEVEFASDVSYSLEQNYPNPFNPETIIKYQIPENGFVTLKIYDILGREMKSLVNAKQDAGKYEVKFDASGLASGIYIYKISANHYSALKKLMLVK